LEKLLNNPVYTSDLVTRHEAQLQLVNDFFDGVDTANNHLKAYEVESKESFQTRLELSALNNYVKRAVDSTTNIIYRKPIDMSELEGSVFAPYLDKIDFENNLTYFARQITTNAMRDGFTLLLVEKAPYDENVQSKADTDKARPYFVNIERNRVRNWKVNARGDYEMITYDESYIAEQNEYSQVVAIQQRTYFSDGRVEIWRSHKGKEPELIDTIKTGFNYIPIIKVGNGDIPPLYDLAKINKRHMNQDSSAHNYVRACGSPFTQAFMLSSDGGKLIVGAMNGIGFSAPKNEAGIEWVELSGKNFEIIETVIKRDEVTMRSYLAELISDNTEKTATEVGIANTDNESKLGYYAEITEDAINKAFIFMADYQDIPNFEAKVYLNKDFFDKTLTDAQVREYKGLFVDGVISWEKLMELLINGEVLEPMDEEALQIEKARVSETL
jgi:hypothetical protein